MVTVYWGVPPPCVCLVSALAAPPNLVWHVSAVCLPCVRGCPACARHVFTLCPPRKPCPPCVCKPCPPSPPCVCFGLPSKPWPPCVGQASCPPCLVSALCRLWPRLKRCVSHVALCVRHVSAPCYSLSSRCPLVVRSLSTLCRFLAGSMVWLWPGFCQLCVRFLVFGPLSVLCPLLSASVEVFVATPLLAA